jgi:hypothetical protein
VSLGVSLDAEEAAEAPASGSGSGNASGKASGSGSDGDGDSGSGSCSQLCRECKASLFSMLRICTVLLLLYF